MPKGPLKFNIKPPKGSRFSSYLTRSPIVPSQTPLKGTLRAKKAKIRKLANIGLHSNLKEDQKTRTPRQPRDNYKEIIA